MNIAFQIGGAVTRRVYYILGWFESQNSVNQLSSHVSSESSTFKKISKKLVRDFVQYEVCDLFNKRYLKTHAHSPSPRVNSQQQTTQKQYYEFHNVCARLLKTSQTLPK